MNSSLQSWQVMPIYSVWAAMASWQLYFCYRCQSHDRPSLSFIPGISGLFLISSHRQITWRFLHSNSTGMFVLIEIRVAKGLLIYFVIIWKKIWFGSLGAYIWQVLSLTGAVATWSWVHSLREHQGRPNVSLLMWPLIINWRGNDSTWSWSVGWVLSAIHSHLFTTQSCDHCAICRSAVPKMDEQLEDLDLLR